MKVTLQHTLAQDGYHWAVFMDREIVGVLFCNRTQTRENETIGAVAVNRTTLKTTVIDTNLLRDVRHPGLSSVSSHSTPFYQRSFLFTMVNREPPYWMGACTFSSKRHRRRSSTPSPSDTSLGM